MQHDLGTAHDEDLKSLNSRAHEDFEKIADSGVNYPCIIVSSEVFARLASVYGEGPLTVNVDLDILRDGTGNVFVDVKFSAADVHESFLIDAAKHTWFFHVLAESSLVGVAPKNADGRMFAVQLPKPDAEGKHLKKYSQVLENNGAVAV